LKYKVDVEIVDMNDIHISQIKSLRTNIHNKINTSHTTIYMGTWDNLLNLLPNMILYHNKMKYQNTEKKNNNMA